MDTAQPSGRVAPATGATGATGATILLVEDEPLLLRMGAAVLREHGFRVIAAADGPGALDAARAEPGVIDLVVSDVVMPGLDGPGLITALRSGRPGLAALLVSGNPPDPEWRSAGAGQRTEFLAKPFMPAQLVRKVLDLLGASAFPGPTGPHPSGRSIAQPPPSAL